MLEVEHCREVMWFLNTVFTFTFCTLSLCIWLWRSFFSSTNLASSSLSSSFSCLMMRSLSAGLLFYKTDHNKNHIAHMTKKALPHTFLLEPEMVHMCSQSFLTMSWSVSSSLKWLRPFIGGLGESLSDKMITSSSSGDGGRLSLFILLEAHRTVLSNSSVIIN